MTKKKSDSKKKKNMTVYLDSDYYDSLKNLSYELSSKENKKVGISEMVRRALNKHYKLSKYSSSENNDKSSKTD